MIECVITKGIIKQEEVIDYDVNYYRANYRRCEKVQEIDNVKLKPHLIDDEHREVEIVEIFKAKKVESCKIIKEKKIESCKIVEDKKVEFCEIIEEILESFGLIEDKDYRLY